MKNNYNEEVNKIVNNGVKNIKETSKILNNDKPIFKKEDYNLTEGKPLYFDIDKLERATGAMAILSKNTIPLVIKKNLKYPNPYGWNKNLENKNVFERCHIIAYSLFARFADKKNIFIGTNFLNTSIMAKIERRVHNYIMENNVKVLYKVTIRYKGVDQIPTGILIEAKSLDDDFNVCEFCYNVQKGVKFNYKDGTIIEDTRLNSIRKAINLLNKKSNLHIIKKNKEQTKDYIIDRKKLQFHLKDANCKTIDNIGLKFLNETTATKTELLKVDLTACNCCNEN